jgi:hypothetical protein
VLLWSGTVTTALAEFTELAFFAVDLRFFAGGAVAPASSFGDVSPSASTSILSCGTQYLQQLLPIALVLWRSLHLLSKLLPIASGASFL